MVKSISIKQIYDEISKSVVGNENVKRVLSTMGYFHAANILHTMSKRTLFGHAGNTETLKPKEMNSTVLLLGKSGTGKTYSAVKLVEAINTLLSVSLPYRVIDCASLSPAGYKGNDIEKELEEILDKILKDTTVGQFSVIILDEIDKLTKDTGSSEFYRRIQYQLLRLVEGADVSFGEGRSKGSLDTSNFLFILCGNFPAVRAIRVENNKPRVSYGFTGAGKESTKTSGKSLTENLFYDLESAGMASQLLGRITAVAETELLSKAQLRKLVDRRLDSYRIYTPHDDDICSLTEEEISNIVDSVYDKDTGVRAIDSRIGEIVFNRMMDKDIAFTTESNDDEVKAKILASICTDSPPDEDLVRLVDAVFRRYEVDAVHVKSEFIRRVIMANTYPEVREIFDEIFKFCEEYHK